MSQKLDIEYSRAMYLRVNQRRINNRVNTATREMVSNFIKKLSEEAGTETLNSFSALQIEASTLYENYTTAINFDKVEESE
jgi:hypothetical protein